MNIASAFPSGLLRLALAGCSRDRKAYRLLILTYHRVTEADDPIWPGNPDREEFRRHLRFLKTYCNVMTITDAAAALQSGELPPASVCITFDDGYRDNFEIALPELRAVDLRATFFVASGYLNGGVMWNDRIIEALRSTGEATLNLGRLGKFNFAEGQGRSKAASEIIGAIRYLSFEEREEISTNVAKSLGVDLSSTIMMTDEMVQVLHRSGMEIGAHTVRHPILSELDEVSSRSEIMGSKVALESILRSPVTSLAYPNGRFGKDFSEREMMIARDSGFHVAVSTNWGAASRRSHLMALPRVGLSGSRVTRLASQLGRAFRISDDSSTGSLG